MPQHIGMCCMTMINELESPILRPDHVVLMYKYISAKSELWIEIRL